MQKWIGNDLGGTTIKGAVVLENGTIIVKEERRTSEKCGTDFVLDSIAALVRD